ncbi:flagellar basal-body rod protein FlgG [Lutispora thermophila]|uniref:Flagellar basal-body rod protein FlgG n=1 Tax=Lutispora thermophila DSM 19022 TaxID=1122184 RepID=A0A1M6ANL6_9FIRM|nr:flagellar basal-body rod protein FlgG [Lutispora thermophila]SHI38076.1 flagellar basal-body rod protein FlgG [Lutispora thermophila DSM 19022]
MMRALWTASTGMTAQQLNVDNISNNLANVNTIGYKKSRAEFKDLLYETLERDTIRNGEGKPVSVQVGHGVRTSAITKFFTTGNLEQTSNPYDLAIDGNGFFVVMGPNGEELYTKDGSFKISVDEDTTRLVTSDGYFVQGDMGDIELGMDVKQVMIDEAGIITVKRTDDTLEEIGALTIVTFANPAGLESVGSNFYKATGASGEAVDTENDGSGGKVLQGFLEYSNVQIVEEMVKLIQAQRAYEINSKSIQTADEMLSLANNLRR